MYTEKTWFPFVTHTPEQQDSGNIEALFENEEGEPELATLRLYHYADGRSAWGHSTPAPNFRWQTHHAEYIRWRFINGHVPTPDEQGNCILVWRWDHAPGELRALSDHGGDEDWVVLVPENEWEPSWLSTGVAVSEHKLPDKRTVYIQAHA